jgi:hypothetical protein
MQSRLASLAAIMLLVSACASEEEVRRQSAGPPPIVRAPVAVPAAAPTEYRQGIVVPDIPPGISSNLSTVSPLPPRAPLYQITAPSVSAPVGASPNLGPVTGYGTGGMGTVPGSPANPPYH